MDRKGAATFDFSIVSKLEEQFEDPQIVNDLTTLFVTGQRHLPAKYRTARATPEQRRAGHLATKQPSNAGHAKGVRHSGDIMNDILKRCIELNFDPVQKLVDLYNSDMANAYVRNNIAAKLMDRCYPEEKSLTVAKEHNGSITIRWKAPQITEYDNSTLENAALSVAGQLSQSESIAVDSTVIEAEAIHCEPSKTIDSDEEAE